MKLIKHTRISNDSKIYDLSIVEAFGAFWVMTFGISAWGEQYPDLESATEDFEAAVKCTFNHSQFKYDNTTITNLK